MNNATLKGSCTEKDKALARGVPPIEIFVEFKRDPLNPGRDYFVGRVFFYKIDAEANASHAYFKYRLEPAK